MRGKTINIFMPDGNPKSVKICDIKDSVVKAIFIPRNKLEEVSKRQDLQDPGVYFLFANTDDGVKPSVYIGEAENLFSRIKQHNATKDFWSAAICIVSEKRNINKAHAKFLESYCWEQARLINKCTLENNAAPTQSSLTEQDIDFMMSFFDDLKILITTLGLPIFEENKKEAQKIFICKGKDAYAEGEYSEDGMLVFKGAKANMQEAKALGETYVKLRRKLIDQKIMTQVGDAYVLNEDYIFTSPSPAAAVLLGRAANGWTEWKNSEGKTLDDIFRT